MKYETWILTFTLLLAALSRTAGAAASASENVGVNIPNRLVQSNSYSTIQYLSPHNTNRRHQVRGLIVSVSYVLRNSRSLVGKNITVIGILSLVNETYTLTDEIARAKINLDFGGTNITTATLNSILGWKCFVVAIVKANPPTLEVLKLTPRNHIPPSTSPQIASQTSQNVTNSISYTLNWSGYVVSDTSVTPITSVYGAWSVPTVNPASPKPGYSSTWIGIGGYGSSDLIQTGTAQEVDCTSCSPFYYGWYELLPASETYLFNVNPGDSISAQIQYQGSNSWYISISDTTIGCPSACWSTTLSYASSFSSGEWIHEAPSLGGILPLAKTSDASFTGAKMTGSTGTNSLGVFNTNQLLMVDNSFNFKAEPGCLPSPDRFDVSYTYDLSQEPPILTGCSFSPSSVNAGSAFTAQYTIDDPNPNSISAGLGAAIRQSSTTGSIVDATHETVITINPGASLYSRQFSTSPSSPAASYDWQMSLWTGSPRTSNQYTASGWSSDGLQILQQTVTTTTTYSTSTSTQQTSSTSSLPTTTTTTLTSTSISTTGQVCYTTSTTQTTNTLIQGTVTPSTTSTTATTTSSTFLTTTSLTSTSTSTSTTITTTTVCTQTATSTATSTSSTTFTRPSSSISLNTPSSVSLGSSANFAGSISPNPGNVQVTLNLSLDGVTYTPFITTVTDATGSYSVSWIPPHPGSYSLEASWSGNSQLAGSTTSPASLTVTGTLTPSASVLLTTPGTASQGQIIEFSITIYNPTGTGLTTLVTIQMQGPNNYALFDTVQANAPANSYSTVYYDWTVPNQPGTYSVNVGLLPNEPAAVDTATVQVT